MKGILKLLFSIGGISAALFASCAYASGFKMEFQSASVLADAGDAAVVEDAGTNWYNSAGLVYLPQQLVLGGMYVYNPTIFKGTATAPTIIPRVPPIFTFRASGEVSSHNNVYVPLLHYSLPLGDCAAFGLSIVPSWGLLENYGDNSITRYDANRIYTRSLQISPSIAIRLGSQWSFGIGPDAHYWYLSLKNHVRTQPLTRGDSIARSNGDDWGYGFHAGVLFRPWECTRIGLNYRGKIVNTLRGYSLFNFYLGRTFETNNFRLKINMPPVTALSVYHEINPCWALMGTISYEQWSVIKNLHGLNFMTPTGVPASVVLRQNFSNTFDFSLGTHYRLNPKILFRASVKYLQTPTQNRYRDIIFPDQAKIGLNLGARYQYKCNVAFDVVYAHVWVRDAKINYTNTFFANSNGHVSSHLDIFGGQVVWSI